MILYSTLLYSTLDITFFAFQYPIGSPKQN